MTTAAPLNLALGFSEPGIDADTQLLPPSGWKPPRRRCFAARSAPKRRSRPYTDKEDLKGREAAEADDASSSDESDPWDSGDDAECSSSRRRWVTAVSAWRSAGHRRSSRTQKEAADHSAKADGDQKPPMSILLDSADETQTGTVVGEAASSWPASSMFCLGGMSGSTLALGLRDGSVWIFASRPLPKKLVKSTSSSKRPTRPPSILLSGHGSTSPSAAATGSTFPSRSHSPTPSMQSSRSRRTAASLAGFTTSPTSPTVGTTTPIMPAVLSDVDSSSIAGGSHSAVTKQGEVERQLEAQWHAGNKESSSSVMSGVMGKLGLSHTPQQHPHSHARLTPTPGTDASLTAASNGSQSNSEQSADLSERIGQQKGPRARASSALGLLPRSHPYHPRSEESSTQTVSQSDERDDESSIPDRLYPIIQLLTPDTSPVVSILLRSQPRQRLVPSSASPNSLVVLQEGGKLTEWSLLDGRQMGHLDLSSHHLYGSSKDTTVAPVKATSHLSIPHSIAHFASLRSYAGTPDGSRSDTKTSSDAGAHFERFKMDVLFTSLRQVNNTGRSKSPQAQATLPNGDEIVSMGTLERNPLDGELFLAHNALKSQACLLSCLGTMPDWRMSCAIDLPEADQSVSSVARTCTRSHHVEILYLDIDSHLRSVVVPLTALAIAGWGPPELKVDVAPSASPFLAALRGATSGMDSPKVIVSDEASSTARVSGASAKLASLAKAADEANALRHADLGQLSLPDSVVVQGIDTCGSMIMWWGSQYLALGLIKDGAVETSVTTGAESPEISEARKCSEDEEIDQVVILLACKSTNLIATVEGAFRGQPTITLSGGGDSAEAATLMQGVISNDQQVIAVQCSPNSLEIQSNAGTGDPTTLFHTKVQSHKVRPPTTAVLPLSMERVCLASAEAGLTVLPLIDVVSASSLSETLANTTENASQYSGILTLLQLEINFRTSNKYIVGGTAQGDLIFWDAVSFKIQAEWAIFTSHVVAVIAFGQTDNTLRLHGCLVAISAEGNVAVVLLDGLKLLSIIPNRGADGGACLSMLAVRADELLLLYDDERARVWDMRTQELRRSIAFHEALALINDGNGAWTLYDATGTTSIHKGSSGVLSTITSARGNAASTLLADMRRAIEAAARTVTPTVNAVGSMRGAPGVDDALFSEPASNAFKTIGRTAARSARTPLAHTGVKKATNILRPLLLSLLPWGFSERQDVQFKRLVEPISSPRSNVSLGLHSAPGFLARTYSHSVRDVWSISPLISTDYLLALIGMLNVLAHVEELESTISDCITFLALDLPVEIGASFQPLSLPRLSEFVLDSNYELQQAARTLFATTLERMPQEVMEALCEEWQPLLPNLQISASHEKSPQALSLLGMVAVDRYKMLSPALLKDISNSIALYIHNDSRPMHQAIAIELCCSGFSIWQHYFDAMEVVRSIFALSTSKDANVVSENRALARQATLQIAADNTPLFMTTLSHDILHARSPAHCSATMRLVAFMVRRKPLILYPNLPRLAEAVVKSLDPTVTAMREAVVQAATVMIGELVRAYPSIAFHGKGQRLAVGTHEGAVILYDLKTATRLYVLEGHRRQLSACSFAPDGRRLVTVSLDENKALIWKVGTSITSMFTPGSMPRQGGTDPSGAYKAIDFHLGDAAPTDAAEALEAITMEWQDERNVRLRVGQASMNFSVG